MTNKNKENQIIYKIIRKKFLNCRTSVSRLKLPTENTTQWTIKDLHWSISSVQFRNLGTKRRSYKFPEKEENKQRNPQRIRNQKGSRLLNNNTGSQKTTEPCLQNSEGKRLHASNFTHSQIIKKVTKQNPETLSYLGHRIIRGHTGVTFKFYSETVKHNFWLARGQNFFFPYILSQEETRKRAIPRLRE